MGARDAGGKVEARGGSSGGIFECRWEWDMQGGAREHGAGEGLPEGDDSGVPVCNGGEDRDAQKQFELITIDAQAGFFRGVYHVENDHGRNPDLEDLAEEIKISIQVGCVENDHYDVGDRFAGDATEQDVSGDGFVGRAGLEAVATGEVEEPHQFAVGSVEGALFFFNGDAGVVADFLAESCEGVEEGRLAAVRVADDGDASPNGGGSVGSCCWGVGLHAGGWC